MPPNVRQVQPHEYEAFHRVDGAAFGYVPDAETLDRMRPYWGRARAFGAFEGEQVVASSATIPMQITVPGEVSLPMAGVSAVGVLPTHRRRGLLTAMMRHLFEDAREHGEPLAGLWASESIIYGRFGYGLAIEHQSWEIDRNYAAFASAPDSPGTIRLVDAAEARARCREAWDALCSAQPGFTARDGSAWERRFDDKRNNAPQFFLLYEEDGRCDGYALYRVRDDWQEGIPQNEVTVAECVAATDAAHAALWRYLFSLDLTKTVRANNRPADDAVQHMLADTRRLLRRTRDAMWLRLIDAPRALEARTYAPGRLVLELRDEVCGWNEGRYELASDGVESACRPTTAEPDLIAPAASLAAAYLGGTRLSALVRAGRLEECRPAAAARADVMFATDRAPWCPEHW